MSGIQKKPAGSPFFRYLSNGATHDAKVNGSVTPVEFVYTAPQPVAIYRMLVHVQDGGVWTATTYGSIATLSNGIDVEVQTALRGTIDLLDGESIKKNADWGGVFYDLDFVTLGSGDTILNGRWTFANSGMPLILMTGDKLVVRINDDLTALTEHHFFINGCFIAGNTEPWLVPNDGDAP